MQPRLDSNLRIKGEPDAWARSACLLFSNGCGFEIVVKDTAIVGVGGAKHTMNWVHLGSKGEHAWVANASKRRDMTPVIHRSKNETLRESSWPGALSPFAAQTLDDTVSRPPATPKLATP